MSFGSRLLDLFIKILAIVLGMLFVFLLPTGLLIRDAGQVLLSTEAMSNLLSERLSQGELLESYLVDELFSGRLLLLADPGGAQLGDAFGNLTVADREEIVEVLLPPGWIEDQISNIVTNFYLWIEGKADKPELQIDIQHLKRRWLAGSGTRVIEILVQSWPRCTQDQIRRMTVQFETSGEIPIMNCEPEEPLRGTLVTSITLALGEYVREFPPHIPLADVESMKDLGARVTSIRGRIDALRLLTSWAWLIPASFLGLVLALVVRSWRALGMWWGIPTLDAGLVCFVPVGLSNTIARVIGSRDTIAADAAPIISDTLNSVRTGIIEAIVRPLLFQGVLLCVLGFLLVLVGGYLDLSAAGRRSGRLERNAAQRRDQILSASPRPASPAPPQESFGYPPDPAPMPSSEDNEPLSGMFG